MGKGDMIVSNVVEEVNFLLVEHQTSSDAVDRSISPTLIKEATSLIKMVEIVNVLLGP